MTCPVCGAPMDQSACRLTYDCDACGFVVSQLEGYQLGARSPQEAAELKANYLYAQGWSPSFGGLPPISRNED